MVEKRLESMHITDLGPSSVNSYIYHAKRVQISLHRVAGSGWNGFLGHYLATYQAKINVELGMFLFFNGLHSPNSSPLAIECLSSITFEPGQ